VPRRPPCNAGLVPTRVPTSREAPLTMERRGF
jgi:hypothetical protein